MATTPNAPRSDTQTQSPVPPATNEPGLEQTGDAKALSGQSAATVTASSNSATKPNGKTASHSTLKKVADLHSMKEFFFSIEQSDTVDWNQDTEDPSVLVGTPKNPIIRRGTKNLIEAPEKTFKTTFGLRMSIGLASGYTVYPSLPIARSARVLYAHGEMTARELKERRDAAQAGIPPEFLAVGKKNFIDGRSLDAHLIRTKGQEELRRIVKQFKPDVLNLDPWQSFITGYDENSFKDMSQAMEFLDKLLVEMLE
jgi:AAA domain